LTLRLPGYNRFVPRVVRLLCLVPALVAAGCSDLPDYPPPPQRKALPGSDSAGLSYFLSMSNPNAAAYIVQGIANTTEGNGYRWAFAHPVLRFLVPQIERPKFLLDFWLSATVLQVTGPLTVSISLNGRLFDRAHFAQPGEQHYQREVPAGFLHANAINLVSIDPDKVYTAPADGAKLSFPISRVGFVE
jgi:hypothetical protein